MCPTCFAGNKQWFSHSFLDTDILINIVKATVAKLTTYVLASGQMSV